MSKSDKGIGRSTRSAVPATAHALALAACALVSACGAPPGPAPGSPGYEEVVAAFYTGVAALQVGEDLRAETALSRVAELAQGEPAAAADLAILAYQQRRLDDARGWIERARDGAPDDPSIAMMAALIRRERGALTEAIEGLAPIAGVEGAPPRALFLYARLLEERGGDGDIEEGRRALQALRAARPANLFVTVEAARYAVRHGMEELLRASLSDLEAAAEGWPTPDREQLARVRASLGDPAEAGAELTVLASSLLASPSYGQQRDAIEISDQQPDLVVTRFLRLPAPAAEPPPPDLALAFGTAAIEAPDGPWVDVRPLWVGDAATVRPVLFDGREAWLAGGEDGPVRLPGPAASVGNAVFTTFDYDHDFRLDVALGGSQGLRLLRQDSAGAFVPEEVAFPEAVRGRPVVGVWSADTDLDGDVDLVVAPSDGAPFVLRNQGDGRFSIQSRFPDAMGSVRDFSWGDLDDDGDPDAVFLGVDGTVRTLANPRQDTPLFQSLPLPDAFGPFEAVTLGDLDANGTLELIALRADGALVRAQHGPGGWETDELLTAGEAAPAGGSPRVFIADLDNNGALDVGVSGADMTRLWLADGDLALVPHEPLAVRVTAAVAAVGGHVGLLGLDPEGRPVRLTARPSLDYYALTMAPRATELPGDGRINTFGIGGEVEVRAGLLYQKQPITAPFVHLGIGGNTGVTVARILWPNGTAQAEFDLLASQGQPIVAQQRLKGSCPWLFAFDGTAMRFVTDVAWRTAVGLRINAYGSSAVIQSQDWVKIRGDQLAPVDGSYRLSITAELWESHLFDLLSLMTVDHPEGTEVFVDERFVLPPPELAVHVTDPLRPLVAAVDDRGRDVLPLLAERDERYVDGFALGEYQGVAEEHAVEVELGPEAPVDRPLLLVAEGWVYPTDGSINLAMGQGDHPAPHGLRVEVPDRRGGWKVVHQDLGMPAGKTKTVLVELTGAFEDGAPRRVRLSTNLEIYWDRIVWTVPRRGDEARTVRLAPESADLRYRGFSRTRQAGRRAPELPEYELAGTAPLWRDLEGFHTRFGDVLPLLTEVDDRYVIMNAGDELTLRFGARPDPPTGWIRDYVLISDAWVKDGDFNNGYSRTLRPLPYKGMTDYATPPGRLEDDPVYRRHPEDWREYHTRYVRPTRFEHALSRD